MTTPNQQQDEFNAESQAARTGFVKEFFQFLGNNKKWWLLPIVICTLLLALLMIFGSTAAAPFIYTLF